jgi:hypothetical protein
MARIKQGDKLETKTEEAKRMATRGYFMITVKEEFYRNYYQDVLRDLKAVPEVDSIQRISGTHNLLVKVTAPMRLIFVANKILPNKWVEQFCILKVEPFKPHDYEGATFDELTRLRGLMPESPGGYEGLTLEESFKIKRLIHELRGSHGADGTST